METKQLTDLFETEKERPPKVLCCEYGIIDGTESTISIINGISRNETTTKPFLTVIVFHESGRFQTLESQREVTAATVVRTTGIVAIGFSTGNVRMIEMKTREIKASALVHPHAIVRMRQTMPSELFSLHADGALE